MDTDFDLDGAENAHTPVEAPPQPIEISGVVSVAGHITTREESADQMALQTLTFVAGTQRQKIVGYDKRRTRLVLIVGGAGPVWIGSEAQAAAVDSGNTLGGGAALATGTQLILLTRAEVWAAVAPAGTGTLVAIAERRNEN